MTLRPESDFTLPRDDVPVPSRWHAYDDSSAEYEVMLFLGGLVRALQPDLVVETGTAFGQTAAHICAALEANGRGRLVTIESNGRKVRLSRQRLTRYMPKYCTLVHARSLDVEVKEPVALLFADSDPHVRVEEISFFRPRVFVLHDTAPHFAWHATLEQNLNALPGYRWFQVPTPRGFVIGGRT